VIDVYMSELRFENIRKKYDESIVALENFDLQVADGEFLTIVGPSGSGKSTAMRMVAGLEDITEGDIILGDQVINDIAPQNRDIAMVFQNYALYPHMTVRKNMSYGLKLSTDLSGDEIEQRVTNVAEMLGIEDQLDKKPGNLSGGQQQRVATGRAIVREPEVFLMDEPLSNLDAKLRVHMRTELQRIQEELNTTMIYVTHDQEEAMTMSDRIAILAQGVLQQVGTPEAVYERPANKFVADFIGSPSMNFVDVELSGNSLVGQSFEYEVSDEFVETVRERTDAQTFIMGIRPENVRLADESTDAGSTISAVVDVREPVGSDNYLYIRIGDQDFTMRVPGDQKIAEGRTIDIAIREPEMHLFDAETEENILLDADPERESPTIAN
jgi:multiple sugar transport system ATP-binding protein